MRILFVSPEVPGPGGGGIATYIAQATAALQERGHECHVLTWCEEVEHPRVVREKSYLLHQGPDPLCEGGLLAGVDSDLRTSARVADWVLDLQRHYSFDIIEGTDWKAPLYCLLQRRNVERELANCRIAVFNHGVTYAIARQQGRFTPRSTFQRINLEHQCLNLADLVVCPSMAAREALMELHGVCPQKAVVIPEPLAALRETESAADGERAILFYGCVTVSKGLNEFIRVANRFEEAQPGWRVELMGPLHGNGVRQDAFAAQIVDALAFDPQKISFTGMLPREEALQRIGSRHTLINMSRRETFCYAFVEGLLNGARPLALAGSAQSELIPAKLRPAFSIGATAAEADSFDPDAFDSAWEAHAHEVRDYARALTAPARYCDAYERLVSRPTSQISTARGQWEKAPVSVLIPAYEPERHLLDTIASISAQDADVEEIVIGDDGSRSGSARAVLAAAAERAKVRIVRAPWRGLAETRNRLLRECRTPLFAFVDADDLIAPQFISRSREFLSANYEEGVRCVQGWYELFGKQTGVRGPVIYQHFSHALWNDLKNTVLGATEVFRDLGYNAELMAGEAEDWEFWLRYFRQGWQVRIVPEILWRYRRHERALSSRWSEAMSLGTARANARVFGASSGQGLPPHVWEFVGEYMYLGESFFDHSPDERASQRGRSKDLRKIEARVSSFARAGSPLNFRQRAAVRIMRHLSRSLR